MVASLKLWAMAVSARFNARYLFQVISPEYKGLHVCITEREALQWIECYPKGTAILIQPRW